MARLPKAEVKESAPLYIVLDNTQIGMGPPETED